MEDEKQILTYALKSGKLVHIDSVESGYACNCSCPKCGKPLCAKKKRKDNGHQSHFAHWKDSDCQGYYMTTLHLLAEQIIKEEKAVMAPSYKEIDKQKLSFIKIEYEQRKDRKDLQPDIVGVTDDSLRWAIEICNTHEVDVYKKNKLIESNITCLEIDVSEQTLDNLKSFLLESAEKRKWINNPNYELQIAEAKRIRELQIAEAKRIRELQEKEEKRKKISLFASFFYRKKEVMIPSYGNYKSKKISFINVFISILEEGLQAIVKAVSSERTPYIFIIGSQEMIESYSLSEQEYEYNVLAISTDQTSAYQKLSSYIHEIKWLNHLESAKRQEDKYYDYKNNPNYKLTPKVDCIWAICKFKPYGNSCKYSEEIISFRGKEYVACNIVKRNKDEVDLTNRRKSNTFAKDRVQSNENALNHPRNKDIKVLPQDKLQHENLSLSLETVKLITNKYCYKLKSEGFYETEKGDRAKIIKYDIKSNNVILVLYKSSPYPFSIDIIKVNDKGKIQKNRVGVFTNEKAALENYYSRLSI